MAIHVTSEIGQLKRVLLKRPGRELEHLSPETMEQLLFDDIPYLHRAQAEHDRFAELLRESGAEVSYLDSLIAEVLEKEPALRELFVSDVIEKAGGSARGYREALTEYLLSMQDARTLVRKTMAGVTYEEVFRDHAAGLSGLVREKTRFLMPPIPNLYFTRDPFACIGRGVSLNHMYSATRNRETIYGGYILRYHPEFAGQIPLYYTPQEHFSIEGGDILNLSEHVLAVGMSQRTQPEAIEQLAKNIFADEESHITTVLAFEIPRTRAFMHLDTVFTQVDHDKFTVHPGILGALSVYELTGKGEKTLRTRKLEARLEDILKHYLHLDSVQLIRCGGESPIAAAREQWSDGSNTLCVRPGVVLVYDRNYVTNRILNDCGIETLEMPSSELSRGRGGPSLYEHAACQGESVSRFCAQNSDQLRKNS